MSEGDMITAILKDHKFISNERARTLAMSGKIVLMSGEIVKSKKSK
jgi:hypothetical protein